MFIGISYVGGPEYTRRAVKSLGDYWVRVLLLDNSSDQHAALAGLAECVGNVRVPPVPLTHTQSHNYFRRHAIEQGLPYYFVMHNDAEASPAAFGMLGAAAVAATSPTGSKRKQSRKWAVLFTNYDALACYNTKAAIEVGEWDWRLFPSYYSENDYYYRCKLAGYELIDTGLPGKHEGSHIINKVDKWRKFYTQLQFDHWASMYVRKWGGHPGEEKFTRPFQNDMDERGPFPDE